MRPSLKFCKDQVRDRPKAEAIGQNLEIFGSWSLMSGQRPNNHSQLFCFDQLQKYSFSLSPDPGTLDLVFCKAVGC